MTHALHFNKPVAPNGDDSSLLAVDTLKIDSHSRITFSKEVREILPIKPGDRIAIYQDRTNNDLILKVQRGSKVVDTLLITRKTADTGDNIILRTAMQTGLNRKTEGKIKQEDSFSLLSKVIEPGELRYDHEDPQKRYLPSIILIDDEPDILLTFKPLLSVEGFDVKTFSRSEEALEYLVSHPLEHRVVITDIRMPGINGLELYQKIRVVHKDMKVIFLSALDAVNELLSIFPEVKERDIIRKPVEGDKFINKVKAAIFN